MTPPLLSLDRSDMLGKAAALGSQCRQGWRLGLDWPIPAAWADSKQVLVLGMGGSAIGADLLQGILRDRLPKPVAVNRAYTIPDWVGRETLVLACSYSGNTEETLSAAVAAAEKGARIAAMGSGGKLADWSKRNGIPFLPVPAGLPPRSAVGYFIFGPLGLLARLDWIEAESVPVGRACAALERFIQEKLAGAAPAASNPARKLAARLKGRLPVLYGASDGWEGVTYRWRTQLEENAKTLAFHHLFPEATHNEISGWVQPRLLIKKTAALFLMDETIHPRTRRRMEFTQRIVRREGARVEVIRVSGASFLERLLKLIALGDFTSIYLGLLYRIDPAPVARVEALKKYLRRRS